MSKVYAVRVGRMVGIFNNWIECEKSVKGFKGAIYKSFSNRMDAEQFINPISKQTEKHKNRIWVDGSFRDGKAGYAVVAESGAIHYGPVLTPTNNRGELTAILRALQLYTERPLTICSDSKYSINCLTEWLPVWRSRFGSNPNNWKTATGSPVSNVDLLVDIEPLLKGVNFEHVKAHQGITFNEMADYWANIGRNSPNEQTIMLNQ